MKYHKLGSSLVFAISENPDRMFQVEIQIGTRTVFGSYSVEQISEISEKDEVIFIQLVKTSAILTCQCKCNCSAEEAIGDNNLCLFCGIYTFDEVTLEHHC